MGRSKACSSAKARFTFKPAFGIHTEEALDATVDLVRESIEEEMGKAAQFYRICPNFKKVDGTLEVIVYRDGFVKKHPQRFGMKRCLLKEFKCMSPEKFASIMSNLHRSLACMSRPLSITKYELISLSKSGSEYAYPPTELKNIPSNCPEEDGYDIRDFGKIEEYSIARDTFDAEFGGFFPEESSENSYGDEGYEEDS